MRRLFTASAALLYFYAPWSRSSIFSSSRMVSPGSPPVPPGG